MAEIILSGLEFYGYHGVPNEERIIGHRFLANVTLVAETPAVETDRIEDTVDYGTAALIVQRLGEGSSVKTVEHLAGLIGHALLDELPQVTEVTVELHKLLPPVAVVVASAGVRLTLRR